MHNGRECPPPPHSRTQNGLGFAKDAQSERETNFEVLANMFNLVFYNSRFSMVGSIRWELEIGIDLIIGHIL